jgi:thiol-disulfide isomerase/thioredoxin
MIRSARSLLLILALAAPGCATTTGAERGSGGAPSVGQPMPALTMKSLDGTQDISLAALKGKVVLLDIWASWCAPCKEEMPLLDDLAQRMKGDGLEVVAVTIDEERAPAEAFLASRPSWSLTVAHDPQGRVPDQLKPPKMPTSYLIDRQGVLRAVQVGFQREDAVVLEKKLRELVAEGR